MMLAFLLTLDMNIAIRLLLAAAASWTVGHAQDRPEAVAGEVFVIVTPEALPQTTPHCSWQPGKTGNQAPTGVWQSLSPYAEAMGLQTAQRYFDRGPAAQDPLLSRVWKLRFDPAIPLLSMRKLLQAQPWVDTTEVNTLYYHQSTFNPSEFNQQLAFISLYWVDMVRARQAWFRHRPSEATVVIGVVDDGVRISHEDLRDNIWTNDGEIPGNGIDDDNNGYVDDYRGYDVANSDSNVIPPSGFNHGTHVAGIAAATTHNTVGVVSMAYNARILAVKATPDAGAGILGIDGVRYAAENGAHIINMSWGAAQSNVILNSYINIAIANYGTLFVGGAGNDGRAQNFFPAAHAPVVAVGSVDFNFKVSGFSNYGTFVDIMAPGNPIYSCGINSDNHYMSMSGTSMATPMVTSALAPMKSYYPDATNAQLLDCCC